MKTCGVLQTAEGGGGGLVGTKGESEGKRGEEGSYAKYLQCFIVPPAHPTFRCAGMAPHGTQGGKEEKKRNDEFVSLSSFIIKPKNDKEEGGTSRGR